MLDKTSFYSAKKVILYRFPTTSLDLHGNDEVRAKYWWEVLMMAKKPKGKQQTAEDKTKIPTDKKLDGPNRPST